MSWVVRWFFAGLTLATLAGAAEAPQLLSQTGLYSDINKKEIAPANLYYDPQYPLWTDGAMKSRWIYLPNKTRIDTRDMDHWTFPEGTKIWKEFRWKKDGETTAKRVETRTLEKLSDGTWRMVSYQWKDDGSDATLAPAAGVKNVYEIKPDVFHDIPSQSQCNSCHQRGGDRVLGFDVLQLSDDRDPHAPHQGGAGLTLSDLLEKDLVTSMPRSYVENPPRIQATTDEGRSAMGYLHGNCGHCHNPNGRAASTGQFLRHLDSAKSEKDEQAYATTVGVLTKFFQIPGQDESYRILAGDPENSAVHYRLKILGQGQMPPFAKKVLDDEAIVLLQNWISSLK